MLTDLAWVVLHGGGHTGGGAVSFEAALGVVVSLLVVVGALWYMGAFESLGTPTPDDREGDRTDQGSEAGD